MAPTTAAGERRIVFVVYPQVQALDLTGPHEVFGTANSVLEHRGSAAQRYRLEILAESEASVASESGLAFVPTGCFAAETASMHTLMIPGGDGTRTMRSDDATVSYIARAAPQAERIATVCTGAFLLAPTGLLDGKRVTTHWRASRELAQRFPALRVDTDAIYIQQGHVWTSAGITAGIDLALALVEADHGAEIAQTVARLLVVPLRRPGNQTQYAAPVWSEPLGHGAIREAHNLIHADPSTDLAVAMLARRVGMSERNFARRFREEVGEPPARYVERVRVDAARRVLETAAINLDEVAARCGFGTSETLRRAFHRRLGLSPEAYRRQHAA